MSNYSAYGVLSGTGCDQYPGDRRGTPGPGGGTPRAEPGAPRGRAEPRGRGGTPGPDGRSQPRLKGLLGITGIPEKGLLGIIGIPNKGSEKDYENTAKVEPYSHNFNSPLEEATLLVACTSVNYFSTKNYGVI